MMHREPDPKLTEELERLGAVHLVRDRNKDGRYAEGTVDDLFAAADAIACRSADGRVKVCDICRRGPLNNSDPDVCGEPDCKPAQ